MSIEDRAFILPVIGIDKRWAWVAPPIIFIGLDLCVFLFFPLSLSYLHYTLETNIISGMKRIINSLKSKLSDITIPEGVPRSFYTVGLDFTEYFFFYCISGYAIFSVEKQKKGTSYNHFYSVVNILKESLLYRWTIENSLGN